MGLTETPIDPIARAVTEAAMKLYHPGSRPHANEWTVQSNGKRFLGVSSIVQMTAVEYATRIITRTEDVDDTGGFYSIQGNALADCHLAPLTDFRENQLRMPIGLLDSWEFVGHADGIIVVTPTAAILDGQPAAEDNLVVAEHKHKDYGNPDEGGSAVDLAERQAILYAIMLSHMSTWGIQPTLADFAPKDARAIVIPEACHIWGISVHFWPRNDPRALVRARPIDDHLVASTTDLYTEKAEAILASVFAAEEKGLDLEAALRIPGGALDWDLSIDGLQEFKRTLSAVEAGISNEDLSLCVLRHRQASLQCDRWEAIKSEQSAIGTALLKAAGQKSVSIALPDKLEGKATAVNNNGGKGQHLKSTLYGGWSADDIAETIAQLAGPRKAAAPPSVSNPEVAT